MHGKPHFQLLDKDSHFVKHGRKEQHWYVNGSAYIEDRVRYAGSGAARYMGKENNLHKPPVQEICLPVCLDTTDKALYYGANRKTNNTGEVVALTVALQQTCATSPKTTFTACTQTRHMRLGKRSARSDHAQTRPSSETYDTHSEHAGRDTATRT